MRYLILTGTLLSLSVINNAYAGLYDDLYEAAVLSSPVIKRIHEDSRTWRAEEQKELQGLLRFVQEHPEKGEDLKAHVREDLEGDVRYFTILASQLSPFKVGEDRTTFQLKSNKMLLGAQRALALLELSFHDILEGKLPDGYSIIPPKVNTSEDTDHIYASGRGIALKHLLLRTAMQLAGVPISKLGTVLEFEPKDSPFIQYTPLPTSLSYEGLTDSPYYVPGHSVAILHNGYTFGGHRNEEDKPFGPEDCSSLLAKYAGCQPVSTWHLATYFQLQQSFFFEGSQFQSVIQQWEGSREENLRDAYIASLSQVATSVKVFDIKQVTPGMIHGHRTYKGVKDKPDVALFGNGGHTSFVLGTQGQGEDAKVITIGANRDLETTNRDGIFLVEPQVFQTVPLRDEKAVMYFQLK